MSTVIRPEVSQKNPYWIERHRYYELKHFCLQYPIWRKARIALDGFSNHSNYILNPDRSGTEAHDTLAKYAEARAFYADRMTMVETAANETDDSLGGYILLGVTEGLSYEKLNLKYRIPCCKDTYYELYRRFFWLLNKIRN